MKNAFIFHGSIGHAQENWFPWLKGELDKLGYRTTVPTFPTPDNQSLASWKAVMEPYKKDITEESLIIGHSTGAIFALSVLEDANTPVRGVFLVSGFLSDSGIELFDKINATFYKKQFDWAKIKKNHIVMFHGDNDPYVPMNQSQELAQKLDVSVEIIKNGGHLNEKAGYTKFDVLLAKIKEAI